MSEQLEVQAGINPYNVRCGDCSHIWIGIYLPQPAKVALKIMKSLRCPKCGAGGDRIFMAERVTV